MGSFWSWLDFVRFILMGIVVGRNYYFIDQAMRTIDPSSNTSFEMYQIDKDIVAYLALVSWLNFMGHLRIFEKYRLLLEYIK